MLDAPWSVPVAAWSAVGVAAGCLVAVVVARRRQAASDRLLDTIDRELPDMLFETDRHGRVRHASWACLSLLGYPPERIEGRLLHEFVNGPVPHIDVETDGALAGGWKARWRHADHGDVTLVASIAPYGEAGGRFAGIRGVIHDHGDRQHAEQALRESEERFRAALNAAQNGIMLVAHDGRLLLTNAALSELLGYAPGELDGRRLADFMPPTHLDQLLALIASRLWSDAAPSHYEVQLQTRDGEPVDVEIAISALRASTRDTAGHDSGVLMEVRDLTESRRTSETIRRMSDYDRLTGLPNRELFDRHGERALIDARADGRSVALLLLDLDRFKLINDTLGHASGDRLLKAIAERLTARLGPRNLLARFSGDEFLVLAPDLVNVASAESVARRALDAFAEPFEHDGRQLKVAASAGVAVFPQHAEDIETLVRIADSAMHLAKADGGDHFRVGSSDAADPARLRLALEGDLRRAVERGEFEVYYQPQLDPRAVRICGVEALLRWHHPERGMVGPTEFIPLLEETGLIVEVGEWVLRTACVQVQEWRVAGFSDVRLSVNLSPRQLLVPHLDRVVRRILDETGLPPEALELELTETTGAVRLDSVLDVLQDLRELGVTTAIDDFGIGHSWLGRLKRFPVRTLKIDRSFVTGLHASPNDLAIVEAIVALGHALGLSVVAEGVETRAELEMIQRVGCDLVQGYYFCAAVEAGQLRQLLDDFRQGMPAAA